MSSYWIWNAEVFHIQKSLRAISSHKTLIMVFGTGTRIFLVNKSSRLAMKIFHKIIKKLDLRLYLHFIYLSFVSIIAKMIIKLENTITVTWKNKFYRLILMRVIHDNCGSLLVNTWEMALAVGNNEELNNFLSCITMFIQGGMLSNIHQVLLS